MSQGAAIILVIEDNPDITKIMKIMLEHAGYQIVAANLGQHGLDYLKQHDVDLVLLDIMMPEMDGFEVLKQIRAQHSMVQLPVIMSTAIADQESVVRALELGANDYVTKPINFPVIQARINAHIALKELAEKNREFVSITSHDLKKNLALILDVVGEMDNELRNSKVGDDLLMMTGLISDSAITMKEITEDFLELDVLEKGRIRLFRSRFNMNDLINKVINQNQQYANKKSIRLTSELDTLVPRVNADSHRLEQVLNNLIGNAIKFSGPDTTVVVKCHSDIENLRVEVCDEGPGIPLDEIDRVFEKYAPISNKPTGGEVSTGLGTAICKHFVALHEGQIGVHNNDSGGATFWFSLPAVEQ
jgi:signal transduction histidine kinase